MTQIPVTEADSALASYRFDLPPEQIAQNPAERGASRLLVVDRCPDTGCAAKSGYCHAHFAQLPDFLPEGALLVANNSRVIPARLTGFRPEGGKVEFLLLTPLPLVIAAAVENAGREPEGLHSKQGGLWAEAEGLLKPAKRIRPGDLLVFGTEEDGTLLRLCVLEKGEFGRCRVRLIWGEALCARRISTEKTFLAATLRDCFEKNGHLPLPPYIRRPDTAEDARRYQTVYAREDKAGSVAAPTAGLHFTSGMKALLAEKGFSWAEVTLHVGYGTFSPVRCADLRDHIMHPEYVEVPEATALAVNQARAEGRPVLAVGTTSARSLEGVASLAQTGGSGTLIPYSGWVNMFIRPGYSFKMIDGLITNFHLPESTLLMLVSALTGRERMLGLYGEAVREGYRFFSYGDAMLIR